MSYPKTREFELGQLCYFAYCMECSKDAGETENAIKNAPYHTKYPVDYVDGKLFCANGHDITSDYNHILERIERDYPIENQESKDEIQNG